jgi:rhamnogalacturonyl hydrolase YesR
MRAKLILPICALILFSCNSINKTDGEKDIIKGIVEEATQQLNVFINNNNNEKPSDIRIFPRSLNSDGEIRFASKRDWTSGFYPGVLWQMYEITGKDSWKVEALKYTTPLESEKFNSSNHDIGFKMMSSFGHAYRLTGNNEYKDILIQSARTLLTRFNENVGCIRSWNHHRDKWQYPVIIDNMMNLELLFWAGKETGEPVFFNIAVKHAETTMKNHFRNDYSSYHVVSYDTITGNVEARNTHQGYADESSWARGQAWALYGYTMVYRETKNPEFLQQAEKIANYIINIAKLPEDFVPYWDFSIPDIKEEPRDVSAAAVMASALIELSSFSEENSEVYLKTADGIISSLASNNYFNKNGENKGFLLKHSVGSKPGDSEIDVPIIYADYYFLEALKRITKNNNMTNKIANK